MPYVAAFLIVFTAIVSIVAAACPRFTNRHADIITYASVIVILGTLLLSVPPLPLPV